MKGSLRLVTLGAVPAVLGGDVTPPSCVVSSASAATIYLPFSVTMTFSEDVTGFTVGDITVGNGAAGAFVAVSASVYTATITPAAYGACTTQVAAGVCVDVAGLNNTASNILTRTYADNVAPTCVLSSAAPDPVIANSFTVTATFSEDVFGFTAGDITVTNATSGTFVVVSASVYTFVVSPTAAGAVTAMVPAGGCVDAAGNANTNSNLLTRTWSVLVLSAVTGAPGATVTLQRVTPTGAAVTVYWGDGNSDAIADGNVGVKTHVYAAAGTYAVHITNHPIITYLDIRDAKIGCAAGTIGQMTALTALYLNSVPAIVVGAGEIGGLINLTYLFMYGLTDATVGAGEIGGLINLTYLFVRAMPNLTMGAAEAGSLPLLYSLRLYDSDNIAVQTGIGSLPALTTLGYENELTEANVDMVLAALYAAFPTRTGTNGTIDLLGDGNAAPSGVSPGGAECPPTDGYNTCYELVNDSCLESDNHWASVTVA